MEYRMTLILCNGHRVDSRQMFGSDEEMSEYIYAMVRSGAVAGVGTILNVTLLKRAQLEPKPN